MSNPTLIGQDTPGVGFTRATMVEALLSMRGLTNDTTTGRTPASTADQADALRFLYEAVDDLHARFPGTWSVRSYSVAWVADDHSLMLPANCQGVKNVTLGGVPLDVLSDDDYLRILKTDEGGGGVDFGTAARPQGYRVTGYADADSGSAAGEQDYRLVLRVYPTPSGTDTLIVSYVAAGSAITNATDKVALARPLQRWVKARGAEMWGAERGDTALLQMGERERLKTEETLHTWFDSYQGDRPSRATTRYPRVIRSSRRK